MGFVYLLNHYVKEDTRFFSLFVWGGVGGLFLSTRGIVLILLLPYAVFRFRDDILKGFVFMVGACTTFLFTVLPFALWDLETFKAFGPFSIQSSYIPVWMIGTALAVGGLYGLRVRFDRELYTGLAVLLWAVAFIPFLQAVVQEGWHATLLQDRFDIAYFCFCLPCLLLSMRSDGDKQPAVLN
jgi:hypothetical protein